MVAKGRTLERWSEMSIVERATKLKPFEVHTSRDGQGKQCCLCGNDLDAGDEYKQASGSHWIGHDLCIKRAAKGEFKGKKAPTIKPVKKDVPAAAPQRVKIEPSPSSEPQLAPTYPMINSQAEMDEFASAELAYLEGFKAAIDMLIMRKSDKLSLKR